MMCTRCSRDGSPVVAAANQVLTQRLLNQSMAEQGSRYRGDCMTALFPLSLSFSKSFLLSTEAKVRRESIGKLAKWLQWNSESEGNREDKEGESQRRNPGNSCVYLSSRLR